MTYFIFTYAFCFGLPPTSTRGPASAAAAASGFADAGPYFFACGVAGIVDFFSGGALDFNALMS